MSRILIGTVPVVGHINPGLPIASALVRRGHEVWWYTGHRFQSRIEATGAHFVPMRAAHDYDGEKLDEEFPGRAGLTGLAQLKWDIKHIFLDAIPGQVADLQRILDQFRADVLLTDAGLQGAGALHELGGPPFAMYGLSALTLSSRDTAPFGLALPPDSSALGRLRNRALSALFRHGLFRDVTAHANKVRAALGLPRLQIDVLDNFSPFLYLQGSTPAFEYPRSDLAPQLHFIGPLLPALPPDFSPPAWWDDVRAERPLVLVNQGTVATDLADLIIPTLAALAAEDMLVVATSGGAGAEALGSSIPANARVERYIPHSALMPHVDVMVTNGGFGGVQNALAHGVPLIVAGATEEKPEVAARVAWSGAGIDLKTGRPQSAQIRDAVRKLLANPHYRQNARRIQADYASHNAPEEAAALIEHLAMTGRPVLRGQYRPNHSAPVRTDDMFEHAEAN